MRMNMLEDALLAKASPVRIQFDRRQFYTSYPSLLEIGIMGNCDIGQSGVCLSSGIQCSQNGLNIHEENMSFQNFKKIIDESKGKTSQIVLGGRGDPDRHDDFHDMLKYANMKKIVPNYITSGFHMNNDIVKVTKEFCDYVGVSFHNQFYTYRAVKMLIAEGVKTNLIFVVSKSSIDDIIKRLENRNFPEGVNSVVFILHKPVGQGSPYNVLDLKDVRVGKFFRLLGWNGCSNTVLVDYCSTPGIINFLPGISRRTIRACEAGRVNAYITHDMKMMPCSYCVDMESWSFSIKNDSIENAWRSEPFMRFRNILNSSCPECSNQKECKGGCPVMPQIVLCNRAEREYGLN